MLAMDIPLSAMCGLVFAEAGAKMIKSNDKNKVMLLRVITLFFAAVVMAPNVFYYTLGWPAWETNFMWEWVDHIQDTPLLAGFSHVLFAATVLPAWAGFEIGRRLILQDKAKVVRISYVVLFLLVGLIVVLMRDETFNIASTYAKFQAGDFYSFWRKDFAIGWAVTTLYFWIPLILLYRWLAKKS